MKKLIGAFLVMLSITAYAQWPTSGLVSKWDFTGLSSTAADTGPAGNNGIITGAIHIADRCGNANSALKFNGSSDYIKMLSPGPLGNTSRTIAFWARTSNTGGPEAILSYGTISPGATYQIIYNYATSSCQGVGIDVSNQALTKSSTCILDNKWHHVAVVFDNTGNQQINSILFYVDGNLQSTTPCIVSGSNQVVNTGNTNPIYISPNGRNFQGDLDDFFIYSRVLSSTEILQLYNICSNPITGNTNVCPGISNLYTAIAGNTSYTWTLPGGSSNITTGNTLNTIIPSSGVLSVTSINSCGGLTTQTLAITLLTTPILTTSGTTTICANSGPTTISANMTGATSYIWMPGSLSGATQNVAPLLTTVYTVTGTTSAGCQQVGTVTVSVIPGGTLTTSGNATICSNSSTVMSVNTNMTPGPITYNWMPGLLPGASQNLSPLVTTVYTVTALSAAGCSATAMLTVTVNYNCCSQTTLAGITALTSNVIPTGSTFSGQFVINQNTTLGTGTGGINLTNAVFMMAPGVQLTIPSGVQVYVNGSHLYGCDTQMWQGIDIQNGGFLQAFYNQNNVTLIEDAVTAINMDNPNPSILGIELNGTIFNKNYTSIRVRNSSITTLPLIVRACVFTSRNLPFTSTAWPTSYNTGTGLRAEAYSGATQFLPAPYLMQSYAFSNLKTPYPAQPANVGIEITNIGNIAGGLPANGIDMGYTNQVGFNLFDGLGIGINISNASMSTMNNVFQNMKYFSTSAGMFGGKGIKHEVTSLMNARLNLSPTGGSYQSTLYGNRFWDCYSGVEAQNVYDLSAKYSIFRSTQTQGSTSGYLPGVLGIYMNSNRIQLDVKFAEFNNLNQSIWINATTGNYDMGSGTVNGTYMSNLAINQNYFGAEVTSATPIVNEFSGDAVHLNGPATSGWQMIGSGTIQSNKINRAYRGITVSGMGGYGLNIAGNLIELENDYIFSVPQYGIEGLNTPSGLAIMSNTLSAIDTINHKVTLVHCRVNGRPFVECNDLSNSFQAFMFEGANPGTTWTGNLMFNHERGLVLNNSGVIGPQGAPISMTSDNQWNGVWGMPASYETFAMNGSNATASPLYVQSGSPFYPTNNSAISGGTPYNSSSIIIAGFPPYICKNQNLPAPPNWRMANVTGISSNGSQEQELSVFPNPSSGNFTVKGLEENVSTTVKITDLAGKLIYMATLTSSSEPVNISALDNGIYLVSVQAGSNKIIKKLVLAK